MVETENKIQRYNKYKDSGARWLGKIPEHWKLVRSKRLFEVRKVRANKDDEQLTASQKYGVIPQIKYMELEGRKVTQVEFNPEILKQVKRGDFVISMRSFQGGIEFCNYDGCVSSAYVPLIPIKHIETSFFKYLFKSRSYISELSSTSNLVRDGQALRFDNFSQVDLLIIPLEEQTKIAQFLDNKTTKIDKAIAIKKQQINLLKERKQILIHKAVTRGLDDTVKLKDSGVKWIGEIPAHWEVMPLKYLGNTFAGITGKSGEDFSKEQKEGFKPFVPFTSIFNNEIIDTSKHQYVKIRQKELQNKVIKNDLLFLMSSETLEDIGKCSIYLGLESELYLNSFCKGFRFRNPIINAVFTNHLLQSYNYRHYFSLKGRGFTRINIKQEFVLEMPILIPPLSEQKEISTYIETASQKIETAIDLKQQEIKKLKEYKSSLINEVVTGKVRVF